MTNIASSTPSAHNAPAKWCLQINDRLIPMPQRKVLENVIRAQAGIPANETIIRDHNSPDDSVIGKDSLVDLAEGNVFYTLPTCDVTDRKTCAEQAKMALAVNDKVEVTVVPNQTGLSVKQLFGFDTTTELLRDHESPIDEAIANETTVRFSDGPVFLARKPKDLLAIIVNKKTFTTVNGVKALMTGKEIAALVTTSPDSSEVTKITGGASVPVGLGESIKIHNCDEFEVIRNNVAGGYGVVEARVERELAILRENGALVSLSENPVGAVIFHNLRTKSGHPVPETDVLVLVPGGYPAASLDGAFLPQGSPLLGRVPGSPQPTLVQALNRQWQLVSYHPHNGGGSPPWDKDRHGFHTYYDDVIAWLRK